MTLRTLKCKESWPLQSSSEFSRVPEDSNFPLLGVWASPSHLAQSGVATNSVGGTHILIEASIGCLRIYAWRLKCGTRWLGWMLSPFSHCTGGFRCLICNVHFYHSLNGVEKADLYNTNPSDWTLMSFDGMVVWVEVRPICRLVIFCLLELNAILLRSVFVNLVFLREDRFAWSSNSPFQRVLLYRVRHVLYLSPMYTSRRAVWHYRPFDQCWSRSVRANWHSGGVHLQF